MSSMIDNHSGNTTMFSAPESYVALHKDMQATYYKIFQVCPDIEKKSASALWICQMAHQTKLYPAPNKGNRVFFTDNFYTRHILALVLKSVTDDEARIIGTVKFTNVDSTNRTFITLALEQMKDAQRGSWKLVRAYDKVDDLDKQRKQHAYSQRKLNKETRTQFVPSHQKPADCAGYIIWKDSKIVIFYTNDLSSTPSEPILDGGNEEAILCVRGLGIFHRWTGNENMH
jgi:sporulation protein YlmC with PRC-barrel domain